MQDAFARGVQFELVVSMMIAMVAAAAILAVIWRATRQPYLLLGSAGWALWALRYVEVLLTGRLDFNSPFAAVGMARDFCWILGAALYAGGRWWRWWALALAAEAVVRVVVLPGHPQWASVVGSFRVVIPMSVSLVVAVALWVAPGPSKRARRVGAAGMAIGIFGLVAVPLGFSIETGYTGAALEISALMAALGLAFSELDRVAAERMAVLRRLEGSMQHALRGHARVCSNCGRIETATDWARPEDFVRASTSAPVSHGICPPCELREFGPAAIAGAERRP